MNKRMYKLELICVKYVPILIVLITLIDVILYYFDIDFELINYIAGTSFLTMIPMYISSYVYKFCEYYRMFLHYIVVNKVVMMIDLYIGIPLGDFMLLVLYLIIAGIFAFLALYLHQKYGGRKND
jgi:uncharacterized membrane protein YdjX (TVP38/TMEM64 family)